MAATNFTPIILYHTTTASAAPTAGNLNNGELAINITDGKLFYKDNGGTVQVIATKGTGTIGGSNTQVQYNSSGALAGSANFTFNGTTATINTLNLTNALGTAYGGTALTTYTQGDLVYASAANTLAKLGIGANTYILTSTGSVPQWSAPSAVTVSTANNLAGGAAGSVPYQSGAGVTTFLSIGTANQVLTSSGSAPQWSNLSSLGVTSLSFGTTGLTPSTATQGAITVAGTLATTNGGTGLTSFTANGVFYASSTSAVGQSANLTFDGTTLANINSDGTGFSTQSASSNFSIMRLGTDSVNGYAFFQSGKSGTGTTLPFAWRQDSSELMRLASTGLTVQQGAVFNESGADSDFRVESDTRTHMFFVDASANAIGINISNPIGPLFEIRSDRTNGTSANALTLSDGVTGTQTAGYGNQIVWYSNNSATYAALAFEVGSDGTNNQSQISLYTQATAGGSSRKLMVGATGELIATPIAGIGAVFNEDGVDADFRVESDLNTHMLFVDGGNDAVGIGMVPLTTFGNRNSLEIGGNTVANLSLQAAIAETLYNFYINGSGQSVYSTNGPAGFQSFNNAVSAGWSFQTYPSGTAGGLAPAGTDLLALSPNGTIFNEGGADIDFRVESDNRTHMLFVDAGTDQVCVGTSASRPNTTLTVSYYGTSPSYNAQISVDANANSGTGQAVLELLAGSGSTNRASRINFLDGVASTTTPRWILINDYNQNGTNDFRLVNASTQNLMTFKQTGEVVFNEDSVDYDFRVESDTNTHALFVDAGNNQVAITRSSTIKNLTIGVASAGNGIQIANSLNSYPAASTGYSDVTGTFYDYLNGGDTQGGTAIVRFYSINANSTERTAGIQLLGSPSGGTNVAREMAAFYPTEVVMNDASADQDFRVESNDSTHALFVDAGNNRVGFLDNSPIAVLSIGNFSNSNFGITDFSRDRSSRFHYFGGSAGGATKTVTVDISDFGLCGMVITVDVSGQKYNSGLNNFYVRYVYATMEESGASRINQNLSSQLGFSLGNQTAQVGAVTVTFPSGGLTRLTFTVGGEYDTRVWIKAEGAAQDGVTSISVA